jgi:hypothetical protein
VPDVRGQLREEGQLPLDSGRPRVGDPVQGLGERLVIRQDVEFLPSSIYQKCLTLR